MNKPLEIFCTIMAWLLSIVLVATLIVTPALFSFLSLLSTDTITKVVSGVVAEEQEKSAFYAQTVQVVTLSAGEKTSAGEKVGEDALRDIFGDKLTAEQIQAVMSSKAAKELIDAYTEDLTNAFSGKDEKANFTARKLKRVVDDHIDEIVDILRDIDPECADMERSELRSKIRQQVDEHAEEIVEMLPDPGQLREELSESVPLLGTAFGILVKLFTMKNAIKWMIVGGIVVLSGLLFLCRLAHMSGFSWLGVDFLAAGGINACVTACLFLSAAAIGDIKTQFGGQIAGVVGSLFGTFNNGILVGTIIILVLGGVFLTAHFLLKKFLPKKKTALTSDLPVGEYVI